MVGSTKEFKPDCRYTLAQEAIRLISSLYQQDPSNLRVISATVHARRRARRRYAAYPYLEGGEGRMSHFEMIDGLRYIDLESPALLIKDERAPELWNQVGCIQCLQESARAWVLPLEGRSSWSFENCDPQEEQIVSALEGVQGITEVSVQSTLEAWCEIRCLLNGVPTEAILTWQNCD